MQAKTNVKIAVRHCCFVLFFTNSSLLKDFPRQTAYLWGCIVIHSLEFFMNVHSVLPGSKFSKPRSVLCYGLFLSQVELQTRVQECLTSEWKQYYNPWACENNRLLLHRSLFAFSRQCRIHFLPPWQQPISQKRAPVGQVRPQSNVECSYRGCCWMGKTV